jgi:hypothetical protein
VHFKIPFITKLYNKYKNVYRRVISLAKTLEIERKIKNSQNKPKKVWEIINEHTNKNGKAPPNENLKIEINDKKYSDQQQISNIFNKELVTMAKKLINSNNTADKDTFYTYMENAPKPKAKSFYLRPTWEQEIVQIVSKFLPKHSNGIDNIPISLIKKCIHFIKTPLTYIFNECISQGVFPTLLKKAKIIPIHKKGSKSKIENYRPISLLPAISKILEKIIYTRLTSYLENENLLSPKQNGFRGKRATSNTIDNVLQNIVQGLNNNEQVLGIFCDLSKAFDCLDHDILLKKIPNYGIRGVPLQLIKSYLNNRTQQVQLLARNLNEEVTKYTSESEKVTCGVPQGSILGPILFTLFINDLPYNVNNTELFADDTSLIVKGKTVETLKEKAELEIKNIQGWFNANKLILNAKKTSFIHFNDTHLKSQPGQYATLKAIHNQTENTEILRTKNLKFLGVTLDAALNWNKHCDELARKLSSACYSLRTIKNLTNIKVAKQAYYANFESHLRYGIEFWGGSSIKNIDKIFKLQKKAMRIINGIEKNKIKPSAIKNSHCKPYFIKHKILTIFSLLILQSSINTHTKDLKANERNNNIHNHNTRRSKMLHIQFKRTKQIQTNSDYIHSKIYNKLPSHLKEIKEQHKFKKTLKHFLANEAYYSIEEFLTDTKLGKK